MRISGANKSVYDKDGEGCGINAGLSPSLRGALATKQSSLPLWLLDCRVASLLAVTGRGRRPYFIASVTAVVVAPSGFLVITGSEPPAIKVATVRS
jgi:hypothetical protein